MLVRHSPLTPEKQIKYYPVRDQLLSLGFNMEEMSAIAWSTLSQVLENLTDPIAVVLTGSAKY